MNTINLNNIIISNEIANSYPSERKIRKHRTYWNQHHKQMKDIVIDEENNLLDGYIQYLILKENGISEASIKISNYDSVKNNKTKDRTLNSDHYRTEETVYVYAKHRDKRLQPKSKEYVWRLPKSWKDSGFYSKINIGEKVLVNTRYGSTVAIVTRIEQLCECPTDIPVKKILRLFNNKNPKEQI